MTIYKIIFHSLEEIQKFTVLMGKYGANADLKSGKLFVDAKSLSGNLCMGVYREIQLIIYDDVDEEWERSLWECMELEPIKYERMPEC